MVPTIEIELAALFDLVLMGWGARGQRLTDNLLSVFSSLTNFNYP